MDLTQELKAYALGLGFCKVGVTGMEPFPLVTEAAEARGHYDMWMHRLQQGREPRQLRPEGKAIVILALDQTRYAAQEKLKKLVGQLYLSRSHNPPAGTPARGMLQQFEAWLTERGIGFLSEQSCIPMRLAAERAGVAACGKNNFSFAEGPGSYITLYAYIVDAELTPDEPAVSKCPPGCTACIDACPTKALSAPYTLDPTRCVCYSQYMRQAGRDESPIPHEIRPNMGCTVQGCDICQSVCPQNHARLQAAIPVDPYLEYLSEKLDLVQLLRMPEGLYEHYVRPIMYNYFKDPKYFRRNAAIAMANTGDRGYVPELIAVLADPDEEIRAYAAWALGQLATAEGRAALEKRLETETSPWVREELRLALG